MDWAVYGALIAGFLAVAGAAVYLAVRVTQAWRDLKRLRRQLARELERLAQTAEATSAAAERAGDQTKLTETLAQLSLTLAQFAVLRSALDEATGAFGRITAIMPRK